nr:MAG TPA: hypothetical protein [Caudoviricetes sp.]
MVANIRCNHQEENYVECHPNEKPLSNPFGDGDTNGCKHKM